MPDTPMVERLARVEFVAPDTSWTILWAFASKRKAFGAMAMVKWRSFGIGAEWLSFNWLAIFAGPFCLAFGRLKEIDAALEGK